MTVNKSSSAFRLFLMVFLAAGLFMAGGIHPVSAQDAEQQQASPPTAQTPSSPPAAPTSGGPPPLPVSPPPPLPTFYIAEGGEPVGPLNMGELRERVEAGTLTPATLVWQEGMADWKAAREVEQMASLFASTTDEVQEVEEFDARAFLVGSWRTQGEMPWEGIGTTEADLTVVYSEDGTLSMDGTVTANLGLPSPTPITLRSTGSWTVQNVSEDSFMLSVTMTTTGSAPGIDLSELEETDSTTGMVQVLGADTVRDSEGVTWNRVGQ